MISVDEIKREMLQMSVTLRLLYLINTIYISIDLLCETGKAFTSSQEKYLSNAL